MVSSDGEGLQDGRKRLVRWGRDGEGTQEEYDAFLEEERKRVDNDPELVAFMEKVRRMEKEVEKDVKGGKAREGGESYEGAPRRPRSVNLSDETWEDLVGMAVEAGFVRGSKGNVSALIDAWVRNKLP